MKRFLVFSTLLGFVLTAQKSDAEFDGPVISFTEEPEDRAKYYNEEQIAEYDSALQAVLKVGYDMLTYGSNGMDVIVECLTMLENDPHFNAGGAVFNDQGVAELDASVTDGSTKMAGAAAGLKHQNPAKLARGHGGNLTRIAYWRRSRGSLPNQDH